MTRLIPEFRGNRQGSLLFAISLALAGCGGRDTSNSKSGLQSAPPSSSAQTSAESEARASGTVKRVGRAVAEFEGVDLEGNAVVQRTLHREIDGSVTGAFLERLTIVSEASGAFRGSGVEICSPCHFAGRTGAVLFEVEVSGPRGNFVSEGRLTIVAASGDLVGLTGELTFTGDPANFTYQGELGFRND